MTPLSSPEWAQRVLAVLLAMVCVPLVLSASAFLENTPIRLGEPSPRTVVAPDLIRVSDEEATDRARRLAAESVAPVENIDRDAQAAIVQQVRDVFGEIRAVRQSGENSIAPRPAEQVDALEQRLDLGTEGIQLLVELSDEELDQVARETIGIAQGLARGRMQDGEVEEATTDELRSELAVRSFPEGAPELVVEPIIRAAARPTVTIDVAATDAARQQAQEQVADVLQTYTGGEVIVRAGEEVSEVEMAALRARGLEGAEAWRTVLKAFALTAVVLLAVVLYVRAYRRPIWNSTRRLLLLSCLFLLFALTLTGVAMGAPEENTASWMYLVPVGSIAMLATILFDPPVGVLATIPVTALVAFTSPSQPGLTAFVAVASLASVPLVSRLSARGDLRRAAWQSTLGYALLAGVFAGVFGQPEDIVIALLAGFLNGILTAVIVNGSLPFLESVFGVLTATSLLDLQDRNHPLLRELEHKALGSYNHSIMVSTMVERAARAINADSLLASVAALYHDIGKVRRPYFFVENQFGIANPHDELDPELSATIIQDHVTDGIEMARSSRLPPEVVEGIRTHHGTTLVSYFYRQAVNAAGDKSSVDESHYRYKGKKPSTKEMAILMLADCCEGASRAAAQADRNLTKDALEKIVRGLITDRVEDGQLDEANLTFRELKTVAESFIETLVGVYHPRISYPKLEDGTAAVAALHDGSDGSDGRNGDDGGDRRLGHDRRGRRDDAAGRIGQSDPAKVQR